MKYFNQPAMVLHTRPYTESSLLVDIFTREHGRFMLLSKGARRQKSAMRGVLVPFQPLLVSWSARTQLGVLTNAEVRGYTPLPSGECLQSCYYLNELILKLLHRFDPHPELYEYYVTAVNQLITKVKEPAELLRIFEKRLLQEIGFALILDHDCETGEIIQKNVEYQYFSNRGPIAANISSEGSVRVSGKTLEALQSERIESPLERTQARNLTRTLIQDLLGTKSLRTRRVMMNLREFVNTYK